MLRKFLALSILTIGALILTACAPSGPQKISVTTTDFIFNPASWTVSAGKQVEVTVKNDGKEDHEWVLLKKGMDVTVPFDDDDEAKVFWEMEAGPGETKTESFTAPTEPGTYTIVCGTPDHIEHGMTGTLVIN